MMALLSVPEHCQTSTKMPTELIEIIGRILQLIGWLFLPFLLLPAIVIFSGKLTSLSKAIVFTIDTLSSFIGEAIKWVMPLMVISVVIAIFALSIYGISSIWWDESAIYLHAIGITLGVAPTYLAGEHVKVDIFYENMTRRARSLVEICGFYALLMPVCIAVLWCSQGFIAFAWQSLEGSTNNGGIQGIFILKTALSVMFIMLIIQGISAALRASLHLRGHSDIAPTPHSKFSFLASDNDKGEMS